MYNIYYIYIYTKYYINMRWRGMSDEILYVDWIQLVWLESRRDEVLCVQFIYVMTCDPATMILQNKNWFIVDTIYVFVHKK